MSEDLKPRGEKAQWWLAVRPSVLAEVLTTPPRADAPPDLLEVLDGYQKALMLPEETMGNDWWRGFSRSLAWELYVLATVEDPHPPRVTIDDVARVFAYGAQKYAPGNFRRAFDDPAGMRREYFSAIMRHLIARWSPAHSPLDPESGLPHTAHALCGALMLLEMEMEQ